MKKLDEALVDEGLITVKQLQDIYQQMSVQEESLIKILIGNGYVDETKLAMFFARYLDIPYINLSQRRSDKSVLSLVPEAMIRQYGVLPLFKVMNTLTLAMIDPMDAQATGDIESLTGLKVEPVVVAMSELNSFVNKQFGSENDILNLLKRLEVEPKDITILDSGGGIFKDHDGLGPVNKLVYTIIVSAINEMASDVHLESKKNGLDIRFRLDGVLHKRWTLPLSVSSAVISTIKILAKMDIVEKRLPLDGSFQIQTLQRIIDIRTSSYPMIYGEKIVLRILDKDNTIIDLSHLGMNMNIYSSVKELISRNYGIILVSGPTGSGKTTTLYSMLNELKSIEKNIVTIEDPIEYHIDLINQSQINPKCGLTFAKGLRAVLRQDPDVILIGEIRDKETAETAFQAALTGHLVFSTLHTNDCASAVARLIDMEVEPYLISSVLIGVLSQRLVRLNCDKCKDVYTPGDEFLAWGEMDKMQEYLRGLGCKKCRSTGYKGRTGLFELLVMNDEIKQLINSHLYSEMDIRQFIINQGFKSLKDDGLQKVRQHLTTIEEVARVVK